MVFNQTCINKYIINFCSVVLKIKLSLDLNQSCKSGVPSEDQTHYSVAIDLVNEPANYYTVTNCLRLFIIRCITWQRGVFKVPFFF